MHRFLATVSMAGNHTLGPIASSVVSKLQEALKPSTLKLINESHKHSGHWVDDGSAASTAGETHFKLEVVSDAFAGLTLVKRHQLIYGLVSDELKQGLHALSMNLKTANEIASK